MYGLCGNHVFLRSLLFSGFPRYHYNRKCNGMRPRFYSFCGSFKNVPLIYCRGRCCLTTSHTEETLRFFMTSIFSLEQNRASPSERLFSKLTIWGQQNVVPSYTVVGEAKIKVFYEKIPLIYCRGAGCFRSMLPKELQLLSRNRHIGQ